MASLFGFSVSEADEVSMFQTIGPARSGRPGGGRVSRRPATETPDVFDDVEEYLFADTKTHGRGRGRGRARGRGRGDARGRVRGRGRGRGSIDSSDTVVKPRRSRTSAEPKLEDISECERIETPATRMDITFSAEDMSNTRYYHPMFAHSINDNEDDAKDDTAIAKLVKEHVARLNEKQRRWYEERIAVTEEESIRIAQEPQGSPGWHDKRSVRCGASESEQWLGLSKYGTSREAQHRKFAPLIDDDGPGTSLMRRGQRNEAQARDKILLDLNRDIRRQLDTIFTKAKLRRKPSSVHPHSSFSYPSFLFTADPTTIAATMTTTTPSDSGIDLSGGGDDSKTVPDTLPCLESEWKALNNINSTANVYPMTMGWPVMSRFRFNFFGKFLPIPQSVVDKWQSGTLYDSDLLTERKPARGGVIRTDCPMLIASGDGEFILFGVFFVCMCEIKWPKTQPYDIQQQGHWFQVNQTLWIHGYDLMLYATFSKRYYTLSPIWIDYRMCRLMMVPRVIRIWFNEFMDYAMEQQEDKQSTVLDSIHSIHSTVPTVSSGTVATTRSSSEKLGTSISPLSSDTAVPPLSASVALLSSAMSERLFFC